MKKLLTGRSRANNSRKLLFALQTKMSTVGSAAAGICEFLGTRFPKETFCETFIVELA